MCIDAPRFSKQTTYLTLKPNFMKLKFTPPHYRWQLIVILIITLGIGSISVSAQENTVRGVVKDAAGNPIIGASVVEKGTTNGMNTDENGNYFL